MKYAVFLSLTIATVGCSKNQPEAASPTQTTTEDVDDVAKQEKDPERGNLEISDRIRDACGISNAEAYFAYNSSAIDPKANEILKKLSDCFTTGPLAGTPVRLIGHADPRGDEEYNMVLGGRRADNVKKVLVRLGSRSEQLETTSRGELEARGTDEESWARDRKVRVEIAN